MGSGPLGTSVGFIAVVGCSEDGLGGFAEKLSGGNKAGVGACVAAGGCDAACSYASALLLGDDVHSRCDPFTITDAHSRYLIRCQIVSRMDLSQVRAVCEAAMREYGMPSRIRTDNGAPFAGTGLLGLSKLSLGWMKMGIIHERIQPGRPQQNGRHERMHRTLKEETTRPAALTLRLQQKKFDRFRQIFNYERPHEGLNNATPGSVYQPSSVIAASKSDRVRLSAWV